MSRPSSYKANYMARRARLMGMIESNEHWAQERLINERDGRCSIGHVLHVDGVPDVTLRSMHSFTACGLVAENYGLKFRTLRRVMHLNDNAPNRETAIKAIRTYLLDKNYKRAKIIAYAT